MPANKRSKAADGSAEALGASAVVAAHNEADLSHKRPQAPARARAATAATAATAAAAAAAAPMEEGPDHDGTSSQNSDGFDGSQMPAGGKRQRCGVILRLQLINFMNHKTLDLKFGRFINFIGGENGSGKSAILAAVILGLGGRGNVTGRSSSGTGGGSSRKKTAAASAQARAALNAIADGGGGGGGRGGGGSRSLAGFICDVRDEKGDVPQLAVIRITLLNDGDSPFRHEKYGDSICVERTLRRRGGTSSYKVMRGDNDKVVVAKVKEEVDNIVGHFGIQVDNPVSVLTQEMASEFLRKATPENLYRLFLKATELEGIARELATASRQEDEIREKLEISAHDVDKQMDDVARWEEKFKAVVKLNGNLQKLDVLKTERCWAGVGELERERDSLVQRRAGEQQKSENARAKAASYEPTIVAVREAENAAVAESNRLRNMDDQSQFTVLNNKYRQLALAQKRATTQAKEAAKSEKRSRARVAKITEEANRMHANAQAGTQARTQVSDAEISELQTKLNLLNTELNEITARQDSYDRQVDAKSGEMDNARDAAKRYGEKYRATNNELLQARRTSGNNLAVYGQQMVNAVSAIERERRFKSQPFGPLGRYVSVASEWKLATEEAIGRRNLRGFIVGCHADKDLLLAIFRKHFTGNQAAYMPVITIYESNGAGRMPSPAKLPQGLETIFNRVQIENPTVLRYAMDQWRIDQVLLFPDHKSAEQLMFGNDKPSQVIKAYNRQGDRYEAVSGVKKYYAYVARGQNRPVLGVNMESHIKQLETTAANLKDQKEDAEDVAKAAKHEITSLKKWLDGSQRSVSVLIKKIKLNEGRIAELTAAAEEDVSEHEMENEATQLEAEATQHEAEAEVFASQVFESQAAINQLQTQMERLGSELDAIKERADRAEAEAMEIERQIEFCAKKRNKHERKRDAQLAEAHKADKLVQELTEQLASRERVLRAEVAKLEQEGRVRPEGALRPPVWLDRKIDSIRKAVALVEKKQGKSADVQREYAERKGSLDALCDHREKLKDTADLLYEATAKRQRLAGNFRDEIAKRARRFFNNFLQSRNYGGKLFFDHRKEELHISVKADITAKQSVASTGALSGGERSFSTLCFVMALWESMSTPFRCLDEFDQAMDAFNRQAAVTLLITLSRSSTEAMCQYLLFSPLSLNVLKDHASASDIRVHYLRKADRGQTTLNFEQS